MRRRQEGAGGSRAAGRKRQTHRPPPSRASPPQDLAMWGLLLALAAFVPAVGQGLGAPGTSVLGLVPPATTKAPISTPVPRSSPAQQPAGKDNGELPGPAPASPAAPLTRLLLQHTHRRTHGHTHRHRDTHNTHTLSQPPPQHTHTFLNINSLRQYRLNSEKEKYYPNCLMIHRIISTHSGICINMHF